jgi:hypothetical protein
MAKELGRHSGWQLLSALRPNAIRRENRRPRRRSQLDSIGYCSSLRCVPHVSARRTPIKPIARRFSPVSRQVIFAAVAAMSRPRIIRGLKITWTATCGIACVLLIALWVRSYSQIDSLFSQVGCEIGIESICGEVCLIEFAPSNDSRIGLPRWFSVGSVVIDDVDRARLPNTFLGFGYSRWIKRWSSYGKELCIPHWFALLFLATFAVSPWIQLPKHFSLRTLLLATTLVCVVLGLVVWAVG